MSLNTANDRLLVTQSFRDKHKEVNDTHTHEHTHEHNGRGRHVETPNSVDSFHDESHTYSTSDRTYLHAYKHTHTRIQTHKRKAVGRQSIGGGSEAVSGAGSGTQAAKTTH